jgi:putative nucleotidyltransferase with HDIG domain
MELSEKILFVDDDAPVRTALARSLRNTSFKLDLADGAEQALKMATDTQYAVIATDYRMPSVNGLELIEKMRDLQPDATYLLVSGECDLDLALEAVNDHAVSFVICKPWDAEELATVLRRSTESYWERAGQRRVQQSIVEASRGVEEQKARLEAAVDQAENAFAEALLGALDMRGHETRAHCQRVAAYSVMIAEAIGLRGKVLASIRYGALLHDIGKIGIPDDILLKPASLSVEEWQVMRTHTEIGAQLLSGFDSLAGARQLVLQHHERWDGSGYPASLRGDQISIGARIFAVADTLDAILSERPYRKAITIEAAVREIERCSGTQFDPQVVVAFMKIPLEKWSEVRREMPEEVRAVRAA